MKIFGTCEGDGITLGEIPPSNSIPVGWATVTVTTGAVTTTKTYCPKCFGMIIFPAPPVSAPVLVKVP